MIKKEKYYICLVHDPKELQVLDKPFDSKGDAKEAGDTYVGEYMVQQGILITLMKARTGLPYKLLPYNFDHDESIKEGVKNKIVTALFDLNGMYKSWGSLNREEIKAKRKLNRKKKFTK